MITRLLLLAALFLAPTPALAWWEYGHGVTARIALMSVRPETRREVERLLAQSSTLDTPTCPVRTIEEASVWADCIKPLKDRFSYAYSWHYQNVNVCKPFDQEAACKDGNCVSAQIERNARLLADRTIPVRERVQALAFLVHFVGDLHQPMHAGDRDDLGGNRFGADYGLISGRTNLHTIWDGYLAERAISTPAAEATGILAEVTPADRAAMAQGSVTDWARESWELSRDYAYAPLLPEPCAPTPDKRPVMDEQLTQRLIPTVRRQIARGGLRLARLLDEALGPPIAE